MFKKQNNIMMLGSRKINNDYNMGSSIPNGIPFKQGSSIKYVRGSSNISGSGRLFYPQIRQQEKNISKNQKKQITRFQRVPLLNSNNIIQQQNDRMTTSGNIGIEKQRNQRQKQQQKLFQNLQNQRKLFIERERQWQLEKQKQKEMLQKQQRQFQQKKQKQRQSLLGYQNQKLKRESSRLISKPNGLVGLNNIGNTCFMNSTLQCMFNIPDFNEYFISGRYKNQLKPTGKVAESYGKLVYLIRNSNSKSQAPTQLKYSLGSRNSIFSGYSQQDSQQFLVTLLELLGQDLSRVNKKLVPYKELNADTKKYTLQQISDEWWRYSKQRDDSIILDYFAGQLLSKVTCLRCQYQSIAFDNFLDLSLSFSDNSINQLSKMIEIFLKQEMLSDDYFCSNCKELRQSKRKFYIYRLPQVLIIQLKRFSYGKWRKQKINSRVGFSETLDLIKFTSQSKDKSVKNPIYKLIGVVNHSGGIDFGHYTADCKNPYNNKWYTFNDSNVSQSSMNDKSYYESSSPYLLFYYRG